MKILVIFTGGTIGSTVSGEYISTDGKKPYIILDKYNKEFYEDIKKYGWLNIEHIIVKKNMKKGLTSWALCCIIIA